MIIIHAVQKLLNISRLKPALFISQPSPQQELHAWYAKLIATSFRGKLIVLYVHEPSMLIVLTRGKTITGTIAAFHNRLERLLIRNHFDPSFIQREIQLVKEGYTISKTSSRSVLASMNAIAFNIEYRCATFNNYESIDMDDIEDSFMEWLVSDASKTYGMKSTFGYWKEKGALK